MSHMRVILPCGSKHLDSSAELLSSVAGSLGYVTPEVLNQGGHSKPVDLCSIGYGYFLPLSIIHSAMEC